MAAAGTPGAADVAALLDRARAECRDARFAAAVARASQRFASPRAGRRVRVSGISLRAVDRASTTVWRLDAPAQAARLAAATRPAAASRLRADLRAAGHGRAAISWSDDATQRRFDADRQAAVAIALSRSPRPDDRRLAGASVRAFTPAARRSALVRGPLLTHLSVAVRIAAAADRSGNTRARAAASELAGRAHERIRATRDGAWSRVDGAWATGRQHRRLVRDGRALLVRHPDPATRGVVAELQRMLRTPPTVSFGTVPAGPFFPWPRDGAFDSQSLTISVDKPGVATLLVYDATGARIQSIPQRVGPGAVSLAWNGTDQAGATRPAGRYRYGVDVVDPAGNRRRVAGLAAFRIQRDRTPPAVRTATVRHVASRSSRRLVATWAVEEAHSPQVRSWLLLRSGARRTNIRLHATRQSATVRHAVRLPRGTWTATFSFRDGSGNAARQGAGTFVVR